MIKNIKQEFNLYDILQNVAIGALACHSFVQGYCVLAVSKNNKSNFPKLEYLFYVLPLFIAAVFFYVKIFKIVSVIYILERLEENI